MHPELTRLETVSRSTALAGAERFLYREAGGARVWRIVMPRQPGEPVNVNWPGAHGRQKRQLDPASGEAVATRRTLGGEAFVQFHYSLLAGQTGTWIVAAAAMAMLVTIVTGIIIHKRIFRDFFTFRPASSPQRAWLDGHTVAGVLALPFHLMITYTGLMVSFGVYMPVAIQMFFSGQPANLRSHVVASFDRPRTERMMPMRPLTTFLEAGEQILGERSAYLIVVDNPGDANAVVEIFRGIDDRIAAISDHAAFDGVTGALIGTQTQWQGSTLAWRTMVGLHLAQFGGAVMRWLYFLSGLAGSAMIATGLLLFVRKRHTRSSSTGTRMEVVAARLNVAAVAGAGLACIAYLWTNRLLPDAFPARESWELLIAGGIWLATLLHACIRQKRQAWIEQCAALGFLCTALPMLDVATRRGALTDILSGTNTSLAWVDLAAFGAGICILFLLGALGRTPVRALATGRRVTQ